MILQIEVSMSTVVTQRVVELGCSADGGVYISNVLIFIVFVKLPHPSMLYVVHQVQHRKLTFGKISGLDLAGFPRWALIQALQ